MRIGDIVFGDNEERFTHNHLEEALSAVFDQADPGEKILSVWEGETGSKRVYDDEFGDYVNEVVNAKERRFEVIRFSECFEPEDFREIA